MRLPGFIANRRPISCTGFGERMDERPDLSRSLRDERFLYVRNYMPHLPAGQHVNYQMQTPTTRVWREMYDAGKLNDVQRQFWEARSAEEFYDLEKDPEETVNLINDKDYQQEIKRFREAHRQKTMEIRDPGFIPESMLHQIAHQPGNVAGFCADPQRYPLKKIFEVASQAAQTSDSVPPSLLSCADSENPILRYWLAMAFLVRGPDACRDHSKLLRQLMEDPDKNVAITAAEAMAVHETGARQRLAVDFLVEHSNPRPGRFLYCCRRPQCAGSVAVGCQLAIRQDQPVPPEKQIRFSGEGTTFSD